jgi:hypothetical protein
MGQLGVVGDHHQSRALLPIQREQQLYDAMPRPLVQITRGLVGE